MNRAPMDDYKRAIGVLEKEIERNSGKIGELLRKLGEHLSYQDLVLLPTPEMRELHGRIQSLRNRLPEGRQQVKKILQTVAGNEELERQIRDRKRLIAELADKNQEICETIGRSAYEAYKTLDLPEQQYQELFEALGRQENELAELRAENERLQADGREGKFFRIFRETGRSVYLKGLLSLRSRAAAKAYREAGRTLCAPKLREQLKRGGLQEALRPYEDNEKKISALKHELDALLRDQEKKWSELKNLGAHRSHQKRVREIESEIRHIEDQLQDVFEGLGTLYQGDRSVQVEDAEISAIVRQIREVEQENQKKKKQIEKLNAAIRIEALAAKLGNFAERITGLEGEIESRKKEIETLRAQVGEGEKEIQRLQRVRGSRPLLAREKEDPKTGEKS
jgi:chromosome segregation ATPase